MAPSLVHFFICFHEIFCQPKSCALKFKFHMNLRQINLDEPVFENFGRQKRCWLRWCRIANWVFELFLGDEFVLDLCFLEDPRGRWITCLSKGCTKHFLEKTLAISDCQFLKHRFLMVHFYFFSQHDSSFSRSQVMNCTLMNMSYQKYHVKTSMNSL